MPAKGLFTWCHSTDCNSAAKCRSSAKGAWPTRECAGSSWNGYNANKIQGAASQRRANAGGVAEGAERQRRGAQVSLSAWGKGVEEINILHHLPASGVLCTK